jgi:hypothetical protein
MGQEKIGLQVGVCDVMLVEVGGWRSGGGVGRGWWWCWWGFSGPVHIIYLHGET